MRTFTTMQGVAPDPNWQRRVKAHRRIEPEPVFRLTRGHRRYAASPTIVGWPLPPPELQALSTPPSVPEEGRRSPSEVDELTVADPIRVRAKWRPLVVRIAGLLALAGALFGAVVILRHSTARRQARSWVTLGYADVGLRAVR